MQKQFTDGKMTGPPRKRIGGRASWSRDDQTIGLVGGDEVVVHVSVEIDHAGQFRFGNDYVVEGGISADGFAIANQLAIHHAAAADAMLTA